MFYNNMLNNNSLSEIYEYAIKVIFENKYFFAY